jgi:hypothetical protein
MTPTLVSNFIQSSIKKQDELRKELNSYHYPEISDRSFFELLKLKVQEIFAQRGMIREFEIDKHNKYVIRQLYYYLIGDQNLCKWNINKGIYLMGKVGCGKSVLMYAYLAVQDALTHKITTTIHAKQLIDVITKNSIDSLKSQPLFIDEMGRENLEMRDYGNVVKPVIDLFAIRYEWGGRTYATSNFTLDTLEGSRDQNGNIKEIRYGNFIRTRMDEMFNIVELPGDNRRMKWEK